METRRDVQEHPRAMRRALREKSRVRAVALAFALVLGTEPLQIGPGAAAAAELPAAEAPTVYTFRDHRGTVGRSKVLPRARPLAKSSETLP
jgi:hypothetical protein